MKRTKARKALDLIDRKILALLQDNAKISNVDLAEQVHLSPTPCLERVKRLESDGYIRQYAAHLNPQLLDAGMLVYLEVSLQNTTSEILNEFNAAVQQLPHNIGVRGGQIGVRTGVNGKHMVPQTFEGGS